MIIRVGENNGKKDNKKSVRTWSKTDRIHYKTDKNLVLMDKNSVETDTFHDHYPNKMSAARPGVFLFSSRFLASASLIGLSLSGGYSS